MAKERDTATARQDAREAEDRTRSGNTVTVCVLFNDISFRNKGMNSQTAVQGDVVDIDEEEYKRLTSREAGLPGARFPVRKATADDKKAFKAQQDVEDQRLADLEAQQAAEESGELSEVDKQRRAEERFALQNRRAGSTAAGQPEQPPNVLP